MHRNRPHSATIKHCEANHASLCGDVLRQSKSGVGQMRGLSFLGKVHVNWVMLFVEHPPWTFIRGWNGGHEPPRNEINLRSTVDRPVGMKRDVDMGAILVIGSAINSIDGSVKTQSTVTGINCE